MMDFSVATHALGAFLSSQSLGAELPQFIQITAHRFPGVGIGTNQKSRLRPKNKFRKLSAISGPGEPADWFRAFW